MNELMPRAQHKGAGPFSKGNNPCGACAYLGRPYLPEPAFSALRVVREQGYSRNMRRIWAHTSSSPLKNAPTIAKFVTSIETIQYYMKSKQDECMHPSVTCGTYRREMEGESQHRETLSPAFFLLSVVLSFVSCYLHAFSPTRPLSSTLPSSLLKLKSHLYP